MTRITTEPCKVFLFSRRPPAPFANQIATVSVSDTDTLQVSLRINCIVMLQCAMWSLSMLQLLLLRDSLHELETTFQQTFKSQRL